MENKYYTPEIEEFHVGFEFEFYDEDDKDWTITTIKNQIDLCNWTGLEINIRVKYLDQEDIESLGFEEDYDDSEGNVWFRIYDTKYRLCLCEHTSHNIWIVDDYEESLDDTLFKGTIKNKSELKRELKMIGYDK